jgi:enediyne polyketide synthase
MLASVQKALGVVTGIIHGAGVNHPRLLQTVSFDGAVKEVSPKLSGMLALLDAVDLGALKMVSAMTSVIGVVGMPGNGWYGFANENLDLLLRRLKQDHPAIATQTFAYSVWSEIGMGARLGSDKNLESKGISAIPPSEGISRFLLLLEYQSRDQQTIITSRLGSIKLSA